MRLTEQRLGSYQRVEPLLLEVAARELDRRFGEVDAGNCRAAPGEPCEIDTGAAADFENHSASVAVKVDEPQQMMELFEMILVEVVEEAARADGMSCDFQIVYVPAPVRAHVVDRRHARTISAERDRMTPR